MTDYYDDDDGDLIENGAEHKYLRRIPWTGRKKKYRYVYDPRIAAKLPVSPSPGEKVRVPHGEQTGHYEVLAVKKMGNVVVADLRHDETGHRMLVRADALHKIVQDVFMPPGTPPRRQSKEAAAKAAAAAARVSATTQKQARAAIEKLKRQQRLADALPRERWKVLDYIIDDNKIKDYDLRAQDQQYLAWQRREGKKPPPLKKGIGLLDAFQAGGERKTRFCCLREAFNHALDVSNAKTWRQVAPLLDMLRTVPGFEEVQMPSFVTARHAEEERELRDLEERIKYEAERNRVDYTRYGVAYDPKVSEEDLLLEAITRDFSRPELPPGRQPGEDDDLLLGGEEEGGFFDNPFDPVVWLRFQEAIAAQREAAAECRRRARYDAEEAEAARWHDAEAARLEQELAEWRAGPGANETEPEPEFVPWWRRPR